jgi:hypothetical protein
VLVQQVVGHPPDLVGLGPVRPQVDAEGGELVAQGGDGCGLVVTGPPQVAVVVQGATQGFDVGGIVQRQRESELVRSGEHGLLGIDRLRRPEGGETAVPVGGEHEHVALGDAPALDRFAVAFRRGTQAEPADHAGLRVGAEVEQVDVVGGVEEQAVGFEQGPVDRREADPDRGHRPPQRRRLRLVEPGHDRDRRVQVDDAAAVERQPQDAHG